MVSEGLVILDDVDVVRHTGRGVRAHEAPA